MGLDREASVTYGGPTQKELDELLAGADTISPTRATLLTAAMLLCSWHHLADTNTWRSPTAEDRRVLGQMAAWGYELSDVEQLVLAEPPTAPVAAEPAARIPADVLIAASAEHPDVEEFLAEAAGEGIAAADVDEPAHDEDLDTIA